MHPQTSTAKPAKPQQIQQPTNHTKTFPKKEIELKRAYYAMKIAAENHATEKFANMFSHIHPIHTNMALHRIAI
jgi:hypothetical protein